MSLYEKLAMVDNVDLFVGPDWSSHGFPVSQIFEKYKIPSVMSNVATPVYESGFAHCRHRARRPHLVEELLRDGLTAEPAARVDFLIVQDNLVTKAIHETTRARRKAGSRASAPRRSPVPQELLRSF